MCKPYLCSSSTPLSCESTASLFSSVLSRQSKTLTLKRIEFLEASIATHGATWSDLLSAFWCGIKPIPTNGGCGWRIFSHNATGPSLRKHVLRVGAGILNRDSVGQWHRRQAAKAGETAGSQPSENVQIGKSGSVDVSSLEPIAKVLSKWGGEVSQVSHEDHQTTTIANRVVNWRHLAFQCFSNNQWTWKAGNFSIMRMIQVSWVALCLCASFSLSGVGFDFGLLSDAALFRRFMG